MALVGMSNAVLVPPTSMHFGSEQFQFQETVASGSPSAVYLGGGQSAVYVGGSLDNNQSMPMAELEYHPLPTAAPSPASRRLARKRRNN